MHLWRRLAAPRWLNGNEEALQSMAGHRLVIIERPPRKRIVLEVVCKSREEALSLLQKFGGRVKEIPRDWWKRFSRAQRNQPLRVGKRLVVTRSGGFQAAGAIRRSPFLVRPGKCPSHLVIPAGLAFGTGEHATTAMSLRLLEQITRSVKRGTSLLDLGTGSGIFALAARQFGVGHVLAIDNDPQAIATARGNARTNRIKRIEFEIVDARQWRPGRHAIDILVANLFSELLIEILPKLRRCLVPNGRLILSGVMRRQEGEMMRALKSNKITTLRVRRRGKWIAILGTAA
jgi:ribosomal protein L11 methyltransferase